jgi:hypothetical protein
MEIKVPLAFMQEAPVAKFLVRMSSRRAVNSVIDALHCPHDRLSEKNGGEHQYV